MEEILTMDEAAAKLKLTRGQLYELTRNRSRIRQRVPLPFIRLGKRRVFRASSLETWLSQLEQQQK